MPLFLMCPPAFYRVSYSINPWMKPEEWSNEDKDNACSEWNKLVAALDSVGAQITTLDPQESLPDMVFTANHAVVLGPKVALANFKCPERKPERRRTYDFFSQYSDICIPPFAFEGAGDCIWDHYRGCFWLGYGQRTDERSLQLISEFFDVTVVGLELIDPRFYHLDTAFMPLPKGEIIYYERAFMPTVEDVLARIVPKRLAISSEDACNFAANCVAIGDKIIISNCSADLERSLNDWGYEVIRVPLPTFHKSGGSAFCLTLRLDHCA